VSDSEPLDEDVNRAPALDGVGESLTCRTDGSEFARQSIARVVLTRWLQLFQRELYGALDDRWLQDVSLQRLQYFGVDRVHLTNKPVSTNRVAALPVRRAGVEEYTVPSVRSAVRGKAAATLRASGEPREEIV
jgi:hypothetical protein